MPTLSSCTFTFALKNRPAVPCLVATKADRDSNSSDSRASRAPLIGRSLRNKQKLKPSQSRERPPFQPRPPAAQAPRRAAEITSPQHLDHERPGGPVSLTPPPRGVRIPILPISTPHSPSTTKKKQGALPETIHHRLILRARNPAGVVVLRIKIPRWMGLRLPRGPRGRGHLLPSLRRFVPSCASWSGWRRFTKVCTCHLAFHIPWFHLVSLARWLLMPQVLTSSRTSQVVQSCPYTSYGDRSL